MLTPTSLLSFHRQNRVLGSVLQNLFRDHSQEQILSVILELFGSQVYHPCKMGKKDVRNGEHQICLIINHLANTAINSLQLRRNIFWVLSILLILYYYNFHPAKHKLNLIYRDKNHEAVFSIIRHRHCFWSFAINSPDFPIMIPAMLLGSNSLKKTPDDETVGQRSDCKCLAVRPSSISVGVMRHIASSCCKSRKKERRSRSKIENRGRDVLY